MKPSVPLLTIALTLLSLSACNSNDSSDTTGDVVNAPSDLKAEPLDGGAHLTWKDNSDNEAEFMIERKMMGEDWKTVGTVPFNTTSYHDPNLMNDATYMYRVMAMPKSGQHGSYSNEATCKGPSHAGAAGAGAAGSEPHGSGAAGSGPHGSDAAGSGQHASSTAGSGAAGAGAAGAGAGGAGAGAAGAGAGGAGAGAAGAGAGGAGSGAAGAGAGGGSGHDAHHSGASGSAGGA